jgi:ribose 5-phosphate isomerase B
MRIGIAADHGGFEMKGGLIARLLAVRHAAIDFGADEFDAEDDYPDFVVPLADAVATDWADRGIILCSSGAGASICANKILGARAALIHCRAAARQGVEDDHMNILCIDCHTTSAPIANEIIDAFLDASYGHEDRQLRRIGKIASLEEWHTAPHYHNNRTSM